MSLTLTIVEDGDGLDPLARVVADIHPALANAASGLEVPSAEVTVILTTDLRASVRGRSDQGDFDVERIGGGRVSGKTLPTTPDYSTVNVFVDATNCVDADGDRSLVDAVHVLSHEYAHIFHARLRQAGMPEPPAWEPNGMARVFVIEAVEELRCDLLADVVLRCTARLHGDSDGEGSAVTAWDLVHDAHTVLFGRVLDDVIYPGWPDLVESYQYGQIDLISMWDRLTAETRQVLPVLAHAQALAIIGERDSPIEVYRDHPGVRHYLGPAWREIANVLNGRAFIPELARFSEDENEIATVGARGVLEMWATLGITSVPMERPQYELKVVDPVR